MGYPNGDERIVKVYDNFAVPITADEDHFIPLALGKAGFVWIEYTYAGSGNVRVQLVGTMHNDESFETANAFQNVVLDLATSQNVFERWPSSGENVFPFMYVRMTVPGTASLSAVSLWVSSLP